ncbi:hypothetical protein EDB92DRAFT_1889799, partial [Lactarius akahatsu]
LFWTWPDSYGPLLFIFIVIEFSCRAQARIWLLLFSIVKIPVLSALGSYCSLPSNGISPSGAQTTCIVFGSPVRTDHS